MGYVPTVLSFNNAFPSSRSHTARKFDGSGSQFLSTSGAIPGATTSGISISFWYNNAAQPGASFPNRFAVLGKLAVNDQNFSVLLAGTGTNQLQFIYTTAVSTFVTLSASTPFDTGAWHHVAITSDYSTAGTTMYLDGVSLGAISVSGTAGTPDNGSWVGVIGRQLATNQDPMNGSLSDVAYWTGVRLSPAQVALLAAGNAPNTIGANANLQGYWPIIWASPEPDASGNGNSMGVFGATTSSGPSSLIGNIALPQHKASQTQVFNYLYPGAVQPNPRPPFSGPPSPPSYIAFQNQISFPQHLSGQSSVQSFLYPGALQPIIVTPTSPFTLMPQILL